MHYVSTSFVSAGTLSLLATATELSAISTIDDVLEWADIEALVWKAVVANFGRVGKLHVFAALPHEVLVVAITAARVEPQGRTLTLMEATQVGLSWRVARQRLGVPDVALEDSHPPTLSTSTTCANVSAFALLDLSTRGHGSHNALSKDDLLIAPRKLPSNLLCQSRRARGGPIVNISACPDAVVFRGPHRANMCYERYHVRSC